MSPKIFAAVLGGVMTLVGLFALALPITIESRSANDQVECGSGFEGLSNASGLRDAGAEIAAAQYSLPVDTSRVSYEEQCSDAVGARQAWGWPVGAVGVVIALGALVIRVPQRPAGAAPAPSV